jgi:hypothetical protein
VTRLSHDPVRRSGTTMHAVVVVVVSVKKEPPMPSKTRLDVQLLLDKSNQLVALLHFSAVVSRVASIQVVVLVAAPMAGAARAATAFFFLPSWLIARRR